MSATGLISIHAPTDESVVIGNDGFFPDVNPDDARAAERITDTITADRLTYALANAMMTVNSELSEWKAEQTALDYASMAAVPCPEIAGVKTNVRLYFRAVYALAHADLIERYPDYSLTPAGERKAASVTLAGDDHYRNGRWAIADILGRTRSNVELL